MSTCLLRFPQKHGEKRWRHIIRQSLFSRHTRLVLVPDTIGATAYWQKRAMIWILRKFADSGKKHFRWKRADVLRKPNSFFDLL